MEPSNGNVRMIINYMLESLENLELDRLLTFGFISGNTEYYSQYSSENASSADNQAGKSSLMDNPSTTAR